MDSKSISEIRESEALKIETTFDEHEQNVISAINDLGSAFSAYQNFCKGLKVPVKEITIQFPTRQRHWDRLIDDQVKSIKKYCMTQAIFNHMKKFDRELEKEIAKSESIRGKAEAIALRKEIVEKYQIPEEHAKFLL